VPNYWPWALVFPMVGVRILIDLALCRFISNAIGVENQRDKEGEKLHGRTGIRWCISKKGEEMRASWTRDEVILGLDVLLSNDSATLTEDNAAIVDLSHLLNRLPIISKDKREVRFRNPAGVRRQLLTFAWSLKKDTKASHVGRQFYMVFREYKDTLGELRCIAQAIRRCESAIQLMQYGDAVETEGFPEGAILSHVHRNTEARFTEKCGEALTECEVCGIRPKGIYTGMSGSSILGKHLLVPPADFDPAAKLIAADFITVCPNCHRALHLTRPWRRRQDCEGILI